MIVVTKKSLIMSFFSISALIKCHCGCTPYKNESCLQWLLRRGMSLLLRVAPGSIPGGLIIFCWCLILHGGMALFGWVLNFACCMARFGLACRCRLLLTFVFLALEFGVWTRCSLFCHLIFLARTTVRCFCRSAFGRPFVLLLGLFNTRLLACMLSTSLLFSTPLLPHLFLH